MALQCYLTVIGATSDKVDQSARLQEINNKLQEGWMRANQQLIIKKTISYSNTEFNFDSKKFHQTMFSYLKLHIITTPRRYISLTKAVILSSTSNVFATIATHCNNMPLQVKNTSIVYVFLPPFTHCNRPLRKHMLSSAGSKGHVSRL